MSRRHVMTFVAAGAVLAAAALTAPMSATAAPTSPHSSVTKVRHVFVIMLENQGYASTFANPSADPYLASTLVKSGAFLPNYYGIGHFSNPNYVGFISGQLPNSATQGDCLTYAAFPAGVGQDGTGQQLGAGCVYPASVPTLANQLTTAHLTWKGYMEDMGNTTTREATTCAHPAIGAQDPSVFATKTDGYATRHDPFVYFHSITDNAKSCSKTVVPLGTIAGKLPKGTPAGVTGLQGDLLNISTTPNFSFITPNLCNDGHDFPCATKKTATRLGNIDQFLKSWVPLILGSPAFKKDGLLEITYDEAESPKLDSTSCCGEIAGPAAIKGLNGLTGPGGGQVGAVLISPFIKAGTTSTVAYNHFSSLASIEDIFGLPRLGAAKTVTSTFDTGIFNP